MPALLISKSFSHKLITPPRLPPTICQFCIELLTSKIKFPNFHPLALKLMEVLLLNILQLVEEPVQSQFFIVTVEPPSNNSTPSHIGWSFLTEFWLIVMVPPLLTIKFPEEAKSISPSIVSIPPLNTSNFFPAAIISAATGGASFSSKTNSPPFRIIKSQLYALVALPPPVT